MRNTEVRRSARPRVARARLGAVAVVLVSATACGSTTAAPGSAPSSQTVAAVATTTSTTTTVDIGALPQTRARPTTTSAAFKSGAEALWRAVVSDDPAQAMGFFFPLSAYNQVKDLANPAADWQNRLVGAFRRDIHRLHQSLGVDPSAATFESLVVPAGNPTWVNPGQEYNKGGYWRVYGSSLQYRAGTTTHALAIFSLISWRGEWFVVHVGPP